MLFGRDHTRCIWFDRTGSAATRGCVSSYSCCDTGESLASPGCLGKTKAGGERGILTRRLDRSYGPKIAVGWRWIGLWKGERWLGCRGHWLTSSCVLAEAHRCVVRRRARGREVDGRVSGMRQVVRWGEKSSGIGGTGQGVRQPLSPPWSGREVAGGIRPIPDEAGLVDVAVMLQELGQTLCYLILSGGSIITCWRG